MDNPKTQITLDTRHRMKTNNSQYVKLKKKIVKNFKFKM